MKNFGIFLVASFLFITSNLKAEQPVMDIRYWDWGNTSLRDSYHYDLLKLILEKTRGNYGDYSLRRITESFTTARVRRELSRGKLFNVQVGPWRPTTATGVDAAFRIDIEVCKGLLGYRHLIIRTENKKSFEEITNLGELRKYSVGVGRTWVDIDIFLDNGFQVNSGANFDTLLPMLVMNRFDFVSLGIIEAQELIDKTSFDSLALADAPLLYMPLPFVFYVSIHEPVLAQRIETGLKLAMEDGSFDSLFYEKFSSYIEFIHQHKEKFLFLENKRLPASLQTGPLLLNDY